MPNVGFKFMNPKFKCCMFYQLSQTGAPAYSGFNIGEMIWAKFLACKNVHILHHIWPDPSVSVINSWTLNP